MTNQDHARFAEWDAAYVLGSLSPAERREFEEHLEECERCRAAVSDLSGVPGLLGRLDDARAFALLTDDDPGDPEDAAAASADLVLRIRAHERRRKVRRTLTGIAGMAAAAALASALTVAIPAALTPEPQPDAFAAFASAHGEAIPIDVFVQLTSTEWGTRLKMDCLYHPAPNADGAYGPVEYSLWVIGDDGTERSVSTWNSAPGSEVFLDAATATALDDIAQLDLRTSDGGQVLMTGDVSLYE